MKNILILPLLTVLLATSCSTKEQPPAPEKATTPPAIGHVIAQARIEPEGKIASLSSAVGGIVKTVLRQENDSVRGGETLVILEHDIEQAKVSQAESRIIIQQGKIRVSELEASEVSTRVANKQTEFTRLSALFEKGAETQQRIDDAATELKVLKTSLEKAMTSLTVAKAELAELQKEKRLADVELSQRFIKAPGDGTLISMTAVPGAALDQQTPFADFAPKGKLIARAEVDEMFADKIQVGQQATIRQVGSEDVITAGKVIYAASFLKRKSLFSEKVGDQEDRRVREIKVALDDSRQLLINARVDCVVKINDKP